MIPKASQRAGGAEQAAHFLNRFENSLVELYELRGALSGDLHGAFMEWEVQAHTLTKCEKYLYCLSINPDPAQGDLPDELYLDYIERVEKTLGLTGQPRAIVFHEKDGKYEARRHCHVAWSRIDIDNEKAIHISFDHQKLRALTIAFCREHGLALKGGYLERNDRKQATLYEQVQSAETGLSADDHRKLVTEAWQLSDSPRAFVNALQESGYILANGRRPYVLVDIYGHTHALRRMIDVPDVRMKTLKEFFGAEFAPENLPSVDEAQQMVAEFADTHKTLARIESLEAEIEERERAQARSADRTELEARIAAQKQRHHAAREALARRQREQRENRRAAYLAQKRFIRLKRAEHRPKGLAAFLGRITGINLVRTKYRKYKDRERFREFLRRRDELRVRQARQRELLKQRQILEKRVLENRDKDLKRDEKRQLASLKRQLLKEQRTLERGGGIQMPPVSQVVAKEVTKKGDLTIKANTASGIRTKLRERGQLRQEFARASDEERDGGGGDDGGPSANKKSPKKDRKRNRKRGKGLGHGM